MHCAKRVCEKSLSLNQYLELLAESSELLLQASKETSLSDAADVREGENRKNVECSDAEHDTQVAPAVRVLDVEPSEHIVVGSPVGAEHTCRGGARVSKITAGKCHKVVHILATSGSTGRNYGNELVFSTVDITAADSLTKQTLDEVGERGDMVHPLPPAQRTIRLQDTVKDYDKREQCSEQ